MVFEVFLNVLGLCGSVLIVMLTIFALFDLVGYIRRESEKRRALMAKINRLEIELETAQDEVKLWREKHGTVSEIKARLVKEVEQHRECAQEMQDALLKAEQERDAAVRTSMQLAQKAAKRKVRKRAA